MNRVASMCRQQGRSWAWPLATLAAVLVVVGLVHSMVNRQPGQDMVGQEVRQLRTLANTVWSSSPQGDFSDLTTARAIQEQLIPAPMLRTTGAPVRSAWGGPVELYPDGVRAPADGFKVRYLLLPPQACNQMIQSMESWTYDIRVNGQSVLPHTGADSTDRQRECGMGQATVDFVFHPDLIPGTALARYR